MKKSTLSYLATSLMLTSCASIGIPDGGPYDETPPKIVKCVPENLSTHNQKKKIAIHFDEYIKMENASEKIVVSPPQIEMPEIKAEGKKIEVTLFDTLKANTTYTVDFADAIADNNEGNAMGQFTYSFSTGERIDTMEVSGTLLEAETLEPIKGMMVGLHSNLNDSAFTTLPLERVSRTDASGKFTIKGVAPGTYRIFGLQDMDGNFTFSQKSEKIAFDTLHIQPYCAPDTRQDTIWADSTHIDSIRTVPFTHFYPDDIILRAFGEELASLHLLKIERPIPDKFSIYFTAPSDTIPFIKGLNFNSTESFVLERSLHNDTLTYWITDTLISDKDTLSFSMTYLETDTLNQLVYRTDTLDIVAKITRERQRKDLLKKIEKWEEEQEKEKKRKKETFKPTPNPHLRDVLKYRMNPSGSFAPDRNITLTYDEPVAHLDSTAFRFHKKVDTLWVEEPYLLLPVEDRLNAFTLYAEWTPGERYKLEVDSNAVVSVLGKVSDPIKKEFSIKTEEDFSSLFVNVVIPDTAVIVELLNGNDKVVKKSPVKQGRADFYYVEPGDYYMRLLVDSNNNGEWDEGNYDEGRAPEMVYYYPHKLTLKALWEVEQDWNVLSTPLNRQKPLEITKQKPEKEKEKRSKNEERERNRKK